MKKRRKMGQKMRSQPRRSRLPRNLLPRLQHPRQTARPTLARRAMRARRLVARQVVQSQVGHQLADQCSELPIRSIIVAQYEVVECSQIVLQCMSNDSSGWLPWCACSCKTAAGQKGCCQEGCGDQEEEGSRGCQWL